jgi:hypothetical protein
MRGKGKASALAAVAGLQGNFWLYLIWFDSARTGGWKERGFSIRPVNLSHAALCNGNGWFVFDAV